MNKPSEFELKLLRTLWRHERLSAREIHDQSHPETGWSFSATRKTLDRMVEKRLLSIQSVHGVKTYVANEGKLETLAGLMTNFARTILELDAPLPAAAFAQSRLISSDEIAELERLLEKLAQDSDGGPHEH